MSSLVVAFRLSFVPVAGVALGLSLPFAGVLAWQSSRPAHSLEKHVAIAPAPAIVSVPVPVPVRVPEKVTPPGPCASIAVKETIARPAPTRSSDKERGEEWSECDGENPALNKLAELSTMARIVPALEHGKTVGFKLFSIRPSCLYAQLGLKNGDVVTAINGYDLTDPAKGLEIFTRIKDASRFHIDVTRRGERCTIDAVLRDSHVELAQ